MSVDSAFIQFPVLTTERLVLRQLQMNDAEALFAIKSNFEVTKHYGQEAKTLDETRAWMQKLHEGYVERQNIAWCVTRKDDDTLIGGIALWNLDAGYHHGEIGYELNPAYEKQGIMTEALAAVLAFAFNDFGLHRLEATPFADNPPSVALLARLGFRLEGTLRERYFFRDHYKDQHYYGLLRDEWLKAQP
jgi:ribosomal-protein-alanine N-acetyltransferase